VAARRSSAAGPGWAAGGKPGWGAGRVAGSHREPLVGWSGWLTVLLGSQGATTVTGPPGGRPDPRCAFAGRLPSVRGASRRSIDAPSSSGSAKTPRSGRSSPSAGERRSAPVPGRPRPSLVRARLPPRPVVGGRPHPAPDVIVTDRHCTRTLNSHRSQPAVRTERAHIRDRGSPRVGVSDPVRPAVCHAQVTDLAFGRPTGSSATPRGDRADAAEPRTGPSRRIGGRGPTAAPG
jgi:hypothetical protein